MMIFIIWILIGFFNYSALLGDFNGRFGSVGRDDRAICCFFGLLGPLGLPAAIFTTGFLRHGFKL